jgi:FixJ family two-component response regulator
MKSSQARSNRRKGDQVGKPPTSPCGFAEARDTKGEDPTVFIIDGDDGVRGALTDLFQSVGLKTLEFGSALEVLQRKLPDVLGCLVLEIRMAGMSGLDLQIELAKTNIHMPIVFMTGHPDIPMTVKAMKGGAIDFLTKPFRDQDMLDSITTAIELDRKRREADKAIKGIQVHFESLTKREREMFALVTSGLMNKQIAAKIGIAEITVKIHRGRVMKKMDANSLAELVRMADAIGLHAASSTLLENQMQFPDGSLGALCRWRLNDDLPVSAKDNDVVSALDDSQYARSPKDWQDS